VGRRHQSDQVLVGFELGSGEPVRVPLAHTFVTGQTQLSGKTTTLRALVMRSGRRALAFVTKRGEEFEGRRIRPFLPREGDAPIHWRLVETILASALGQHGRGHCDPQPNQDGPRLGGRGRQLTPYFERGASWKWRQQ
jgi:hypothetical protein